MKFNKVLYIQKWSLLTMYMKSVKLSSLLLFTPTRGPSSRSFHLFLWLILSLGEISLSLETPTLPKKMRMFLQKQIYLSFSVLLCKIYFIRHKKSERNKREKKELYALLSVYIFHPIYICSSPSSEPLLLALCPITLQPLRYLSWTECAIKL